MSQKLTAQEILSNRTIKFRKSLLILSSLILIIHYSGISLSKEITFLGATFTISDYNKLQIVIRIILSYFFISFITNVVLDFIKVYNDFYISTKTESVITSLKMLFDIILPIIIYIFAFIYIPENFISP